MRFQALMPDILHWLGIKKIDRMLSMSKYVYPLHKTVSPSCSHRNPANLFTSYSMKHDAIVDQG